MLKIILQEAVDDRKQADEELIEMKRQVNNAQEKIAELEHVKTQVG